MRAMRRVEPRGERSSWPAASSLRSILWPVSLLYGAVARLNRCLYDTQWRKRRRLPCRVVSVGNLTVGGTGKTPVVMWLAQQGTAAGLKMGVLSRGYRRQSRTPLVLVSDGQEVLAGPAEAGDEPYLIATRCPGTIVAVGADRYALGQWVLDRFPIDCFLLDDGFQHLALARDEDLLIVDAGRPEALDAILPAGDLREPLTAASRATCCLLTRVDQAHDISTLRHRLEAAGLQTGAPILTRFTMQTCRDLATGVSQTLTELAHERVLVFSGIGHPASFKRGLTERGVTIVDHVIFADHHSYTEADLQRLRRRAEEAQAIRLLTTEKDAVKVQSFVTSADRISAVALELDVLEGEPRLRSLLTGMSSDSRGHRVSA